MVCLALFGKDSEHVSVSEIVVELYWGFSKFKSLLDMFALEKLQIENSGEVDSGFIFDVIIPFDTNHIVDSEALEHFTNKLRSA